MKNNPYIGPRPYERGETQNFFGREREGKELAWLILAERAVLFYAQSGAGKTSLLNARVIPILEQKGVQVLPVARVGSALPESIAPEHVGNIFTFSALLALSADADLPPEMLLSHTLLSYLQEYGLRLLPTDRDSTLDPQSPVIDHHSPTLLIFDQFEEIATTHREHWAEAEGFFHQVREAIDALPGLGVLFVLREDYVAELDPYTPLLPSHLQARFRMTLPTRPQAMQIVMGPADKAGVPFAEEAAHNLVTNLSRIKTATRLPSIPPDGGEAKTSPPLGGPEGGMPGQYVEPVQLQVVCQQLWESLPDSVADDGVITWDEIEHYNVDNALTSFYENTLIAVRNRGFDKNPISERQLRRWFSEALITPEGRRGLALWNETTKETAGLPNAVVRALESHYLIRSDSRGGSRWYELSHDRLVEPIVQSNRGWETARQTPLKTAAKQWKDSQSEGLLYRDKMLDEAVAWAKTNPDEVEDYEKEFLQASRKAQQTRQKIKRLRNTIIAGLSISLVIMIALTVWALTQSRIATSRQLAAQAQQIYLTDNTSESFHKSVLLATESMRRSSSAEAIWSIHNGLNFIPNAPLAQLEGLNTVVSPDGKWLAAASRHGLIVRDTTTWAALPQKEPYEDVLSLAFSSDSRWLATGAKDHIVRVRDTKNWNVIARLEHDNVVNTVTFGPNNQWLAAMSASGTLRVWQQKTGDWIEIVTEISGPRPQETTSVVPDRFTCDTLRTASLDETFEYTLRRSVVSSQDGKQLAAIGTDNIVRVWETHTWRQLMDLKHNSTILAIAFSADGTWLATAGKDNTAHVWNTRTWRESFSVSHQCSVHALAFSPDGQYLVTSSDDMTAKISTVPEGELVALLRHDGAVWATSFNSDGKLLATGSLDGTTRLWETNTGREIRRMVQGPVWGLNFAPDNDWLAASGQVEIQRPGEFNVNIWQLTTQTITPHIEHEKAVVSTIFSPNGRWFAAASWDGSVSVWDTNGGLDPIVLEYDEPVGERAIWSIAFNPDSHLLAAGCGDGHVRAWDIATGSLIATLQQGEAWDKIMTVAWSPDGQWVASGSRRTARVWDVANEKEVSRMVNKSPVRDLAFSPDGTKLATGSLDSGLGLDGDNIARIWDTATGQELARFEHRGQVWSVAFSPDGTRLATASEDRTARLWDVATGEELIRWGHQAYVREIVFSPDGWWLAAASLDGTATIWSTKLLIHRPLAKLDHEDGVWTVAFSSDGQWLATGTRNGTARVWQVLTGKEVFRTQHSNLVGHLRGPDDLAYSGSLVTTVTFSPDGRWLATGGMNGTARIWNWKPADIIAEACARLPRNLTRQEWKKYLPGHLYRPTCPNLPIPENK